LGGYLLEAAGLSLFPTTPPKLLSRRLVKGVTLRLGNLCSVVFCSVHFSWGSQMSTLQERLAAITDTTANLKAQFRELDRLREHVRKAELRIAVSGHCAPERSDLNLKSA